jgi:hypothetical protein
MITGYNNGTVAFWSPSSAINSAWRPTVTTVSPVVFGKVQVHGTQLNGLSLGAEMGDDATMASNYPLVSLRQGSSVAYMPTHDFSQMAPQPNASGSFWFDAPPQTSSGSYSLYVSTLGLEATNHPAFQVPYLDVGPALLQAIN